MGRREMLRVGTGVSLTSLCTGALVTNGVSAEFTGGNGSATSPYRIETATQLQQVADDLEAQYELVDDIDASELEAFDPIGQSSTESVAYFTGSFDGNGHEIRGLTIHRREGYAGLFGLVGDATITDVHIVDASIVAEEDAGGRAQMIAGGLVGVNFGTVSESSFDGIVRGSERVQTVGGLVGHNPGTIVDCTSECQVHGGNDVGGLVGWNEGEDAVIEGADADCDVRGDEYVGGLVAKNQGTVTGAVAAGSVEGSRHVGGLIGENRGTVSSSSATGEITGERRVGGLVGSIVRSAIEDSDADADVIALEQRDSDEDLGAVGGLVGHCRGANIRRSFASGSVTGISGTGGLVGVIAGDATVEESYADGTIAPFVDHDRIESGGSAPTPIAIGGLVGQMLGKRVYENGEERYVAGHVEDAYAVTDTEPKIKYEDEFHEDPGSIIVNGGGIVGGLTTSGRVTRTYFAGTLTDGMDPIGGGDPNYNYDVTDSYWDVDTTGREGSDTVPDATGLTTDEMTGDAEDALAEFAFDDTWFATDEYPALSWEIDGGYFDVELPDRALVLMDDDPRLYTVTETHSGEKREGERTFGSDSIPIRATITNVGDETSTQTVRASLDGDVIGSRTVDLDPGERASDEPEETEFPWPSGIQIATVDIADLSVGEYTYRVTTEHGYAEATLTVEARSITDLEWLSSEPDDLVRSSPTVTDGIVYIGSDDGNLYALDAGTGDQQWQFETGNAVLSSPAVVGDTVYVGSTDGALYAVGTADGSERWRFDSDAPVRSSPTVIDGVAYFGSTDALYAVDAATGEEEWRFETTGSVYSSPTVVDGTVYAACLDEFLYALDANDGTERWRFEIDEATPSSPTVADDTVYIGGDVLYAVVAESGEEQWRFETNGIVESSPTVADGIVYAGCWGGQLYAVDATDGNEIWRFETGRIESSSPTIADDIVYVGSTDRNLFAVDATDGTEVWRFEGGSWLSSPTVVEGVVYIGRSNQVLALDAGVDGSSEGSRVTHGTLGHHHGRVEERTSDTGDDEDDIDGGQDTPQDGDDGRRDTSKDGDNADRNGDDGQPGFGIPGVLAGLSAGGYLAKRRLADETET